MCGKIQLKKVSNAMEDNFDELNPIYMMVKSGARGNMNQLKTNCRYSWINGKYNR